MLHFMAGSKLNHGKRHVILATVPQNTFFLVPSEHKAYQSNSNELSNLPIKSVLDGLFSISAILAI